MHSKVCAPNLLSHNSTYNVESGNLGRRNLQIRGDSRGIVREKRMKMGRGRAGGEGPCIKYKIARDPPGLVPLEARFSPCAKPIRDTKPHNGISRLNLCMCIHICICTCTCARARARNWNYNPPLKDLAK